MTDFLLPVTTEPMEAVSADRIPVENGPWQYEPKWDGFRCLVYKSGAEVELRAKSGKSLSRYFPETIAALARMRRPRFVVDGELIIEFEGRLAFDALQMRLHPAESRIRRLSTESPARLMLFDMLAGGRRGAALAGRPLSERRDALEQLLGATHADAIGLSPATLDLREAQSWLSGAGEGTFDGIVAKRLGDPYRSGERAMVKVKRLRTADCVIGGFRYLARAPLVGSLLLGLYDGDGKLHHVGFTSTISDAERPALTKRLDAMRGGPGFTGRAPGGPSRWQTERSGEWEAVRPELVVEVCFDHVTAQRFRHGTRLLRWRPDKAPRQCTFEQIAK